MEAHSEVTNLCSLSEWSVRHIRDVFEADSEEKCLRAISSTFSDGVKASINDAPLSREGINQLVLAMWRNSSSGLKVHWHQAMEVPRDTATHRVSLILHCLPSLIGRRMVLSEACTLFVGFRKAFLEHKN